MKNKEGCWMKSKKKIYVVMRDARYSATLGGFQGSVLVSAYNDRKNAVSYVKKRNDSSRTRYYHYVVSLDVVD